MRPLPRLALTVTAALTAGVLTIGCDRVQPQPTMTKQQAIERVAARAQEAFAHLPAGATLKQRLSTPDMPCDNGPGDKRTFVETDYTIDHPSGWPIEQTMQTLASYWQGNGYTIVRDDRADAKLPELVVEHPTDGFRIGYLVKHRDDGLVEAYLTSSSPCLQ